MEGWPIREGTFLEPVKNQSYKCFWILLHFPALMQQHQQGLCHILQENHHFSDCGSRPTRWVESHYQVGRVAPSAPIVENMGGWEIGKWKDHVSFCLCEGC